MNAKKKAIEKAKKDSEYGYHDLRSGEHRRVPYSEVRSSIKHSYGKKASKVIREKYLHELKPNTSEAIPASGGYYSRIK